MKRLGLWLCRHGIHRWGWSGVQSIEGKLYRCERENGCKAEYWGR